MTARIHPFPRPTVAHRVPMRHTAQMVEVATCDDCGESAFDIRAIPAPFGTDHICANCFPRDKHAAEYDFTDFPLVQTGTRLAEPQLQRVQRDIDRFPTIPANNSYGPHTAEDWGDWKAVSPTIPLGVVAAALTVAAGVLAVLSWVTGWPL